MKKNLCLAVWGAALCATFPAAAETALPAAAEVSENASSPAETVADAASLTANIKRIAVEYLEHSVTNRMIRITPIRIMPMSSITSAAFLTAI